MKMFKMILCLMIVFSGCAKEGKMGPAGEQGVQGVPGLVGADASPCVVTSVSPSSEVPNGGSLITCPTTSSLVLNGTNGTNGTPGTPGSVITMVKLCPGATVYPSKFVELAACMNGTLYGVYSANGGFMTELPPGTYGSNGINSSCSFVIGSNCSVTN